MRDDDDEDRSSGNAAGATQSGAPARWLHSRVDASKTWMSASWAGLFRDHLWQRIFKFTVATTVSVIIVLVPDLVAFFPTTAFLAPLSTIFAHAGQRMGLMIEGIIMLLAGAVSGTAWGVLGLWISSYVIERDEQAAYAIRALFLLCSVFHHGYLRASSPRLVTYVLFHLTGSTVILIGRDTEVTTESVISLAYPILIGAGVVMVCNLVLFPELSCDHLASVTVDAIQEASDVLNRSTAWFLEPADKAIGRNDGIEIIQSGRSLPESGTFYSKVGHRKHHTKTWWKKIWLSMRNPFHEDRRQPPIRPEYSGVTSLAALTDAKAKLRTQVQSCRAAQSEVNLEISIGSLPPRDLKPISTKMMKGLVHNTISLIGSCENKYVLLGEENGSDDDGLDSDSDSTSDLNFPRLNSPRVSRPPSPVSRDRSQPGASRSSISLLDDPFKKLELVKPLREVEAGDPDILEATIDRIRDPSEELMKSVRRASRTVTRSLSYAYSLKRLPSGRKVPATFNLEEMDADIDAFVEAILEFDHTSTEEMEFAISTKRGEMDIMPRMETFLVSSFLLGFRQSAVHMLQMLRYARTLVEQRQAKRFRWSIHAPALTGWRIWLATGGERDGMVLPKAARKRGRTGQTTAAERREAKEEAGEPSTQELEKTLTAVHSRADEEKALGHDGGIFKAQAPPTAALGGPTLSRLPTRSEEKQQRKQAEKEKKEKRKQKKKKKKDSKTSRGPVSTMRSWAADAVESLQNSDDTIYAMKLVVAFFLVTWPGFEPSWKDWYASVLGFWAPLQLILIFEVAIGTSLFVFVIRLVGVIFGCLVGYLAFVIGGGNHYVLVVVLAVGVVPSVYLQLATKYVKTGMVAMSSSTAVALGALHMGRPPFETFYLRLVAFFIGCTAGLLVELMLYPARARDRMVESLSSCIKQITQMQTAVAVGVDDPTSMDLQSAKLQHKFERSLQKAQGALTAAETFLPFTLTEPRLKGSFRQLHPIYREIIYVLHQISDRMDNMMQLRRVFGSSVLEELNPQVHAYRRAVAGSIAIALFTVDEALTTRMPLPQFMPSARVAMLRLVNRVQEVLEEKSRGRTGRSASRSRSRRNSRSRSRQNAFARSRSREAIRSASEELLRERAARVKGQHKFLSWNANAAGLLEIIEYIEELVELVKLLVGVNAFRSGMLERPTFREYANRSGKSKEAAARGGRADSDDDDDDNNNDDDTGGEENNNLTREPTPARRVDTWGPIRKLNRQRTALKKEVVPAGSERPQEVTQQPLEPVSSATSGLGAAPGRRATSGGSSAFGPTNSQEESGKSGATQRKKPRAEPEETDIPVSLQRVSTRRQEVRRRQTGLGDTSAKRGKQVEDR